MLVLVVDDDIDILTTIADQLALYGIDTDCARNGQQALTLTQRHTYDVIVLDIMMPGLDGLSTCQTLRREGCTTPIVFLTARDTLDDKITGFSTGADDYLVKPFAMKELLYRVKALSQRVSRHQVRTLHWGEITLDVEQASAQRSGQTLRLNALQFKLLKLLVSHAPSIVSREQMEHALWHDEPPDSDALRSHLYQLRQILDKPFSFPMLETVRGVGYRLVDTQEPAQ
ncbi:response regulator transcription factor [Neptunomonas phycophila]|uniref:response regulator transcription factor n=1 Tax=Neptunomonas phycophila TaxID=1572645 RepID=UPI000948C5E0|nr:response regulator transcription factor [Neptunomonas phycophila]QLE99336.1 response regulator transcription factor [Neptunomonas phycophila]